MQHFLSSTITYLTVFAEASHVPGTGHRTTNGRHNSRAERAPAKEDPEVRASDPLEHGLMGTGNRSSLFRF